jgi:hypothetical protein
MSGKGDGILAEIERLRRGVFGQQKQLKAFFDLVETHVGTPYECPECKRRREQTRLRVAKVRKKGVKAIPRVPSGKPPPPVPGKATKAPGVPGGKTLRHAVT